MKKILAMFLSAFALGCSEKKDEVSTLEEANMCLLESDKHAVMDAGELIKKAESEDDEGLSAEYFEKAYGQIQELYAKSRDDDSVAGRKRSAWHGF